MRLDSAHGRDGGWAPHVVEVGIGDLGASALIEEARARGIRRDDLIAAACEQQVARILAGSAAGVVPKLPPDDRDWRAAVCRRFAVNLSDRQWEILSGEAAARGVGLDRVIGHAILAYVASKG